MIRVLDRLAELDLRRVWAQWVARTHELFQEVRTYGRKLLEEPEPARAKLPLAVEVRLLLEDEQWLAFDLLSRHRLLDADRFLDRLDEHRAQGLELVGAFAGAELVGVLGMRPVETFARGSHLHVDDLVVDAQARGRGVTHELLAFAEQEALLRGLGEVYLDSKPETMLRR